MVVIMNTCRHVLCRIIRDCNEFISSVRIRLWSVIRSNCFFSGLYLLFS